MSPSSNTFGTFLNTFSSLRKKDGVVGSIEAAGSAAAPSSVVIGLVDSISRSGNSAAVKDLASASGLRRDDVLSAMVEGKNQGLIEVEVERDEPVANLTALGKAFAG